MGVSPELSKIEWNEPTVPVGPGLSEELTRRAKLANGGSVPAASQYISWTPWLAEAIILITSEPLVYIPYELAGLVHLVVSQDNSCRFCYGIARSMMKLMGYSDAQIDRIVTDIHGSSLSVKERAALDFARRISRSNPRPMSAEFRSLLQAGFSLEECVELSYITVGVSFTNRVGTLISLQPDAIEQMPGKWYVRLARPLFARMIRSKMKPGKPESLPAEKRKGPFAPATNLVDGLPAAIALRDILDNALASDILSRHTKLMIFAVIARTLQCPICQDEAAALLVEEGFSREETESTLTSLASPRFNPVEAKMIPLARETVRYQTGNIQRRVQELAKVASPAQVVEFAGIASLANSLSRLSCLLSVRPE